MASTTPKFAALVEFFDREGRPHLAQAVRQILAAGNNPEFREWAVNTMRDALTDDREDRVKTLAALSASMRKR